MARNKAGTLDPSPIQLVEEAMHLLRQAPAAAWLIYVAGCGVFVAALLFFWAYTTWFVPGEGEIGLASLLLLALFAAMKGAQAEFCSRLFDRRMGVPPREFSWIGFVRLSVAQLRLHVWGLVALPLAFLATLPAGWAFAFFQNVTAWGGQGGKQSVASVAADEAKRWPGQNHLGLLFITVLGGSCWLNVAGAAFLVPWLISRIFGLENVFGLSGWWLLNSTFLLTVTAITWLLVDPLIKAFYVLRLFYGRAQRSGADLLVELASNQPKKKAMLAALLVVFALAAIEPTPLSAEVEAASRTSVNETELNRSADQVLSQSDFRWRLRPDPLLRHQTEEEDGFVTKLWRSTVEVIRTVFDSVQRWVRKVTNWIDDLFPQGTGSSPSSGGGQSGVVKVVLYILLAVAGILGLVLLFMIVRGGRKRVVPVANATVVPATAPDLADENLHAGNLPTNQWVALAREQIAKGEWRLALRALYLAHLAMLAEQGRIVLVRSKTNLDYERELARRAPAQPELKNNFRVRRTLFESVWYGRVEVAEGAVRDWYDELQGKQVNG